MYIVPKPIEVKAIEKYKLYIKFENGEYIALENLYYNGKTINNKINALG